MGEKPWETVQQGRLTICLCTLTIPHAIVA